MKIEVKVPSVGESVQEAVLAQWYKRNGDRVRKDEPLFVIETDKVTLEVAADVDGVLTILVEPGQTVAIGAVVAEIDTEAAPMEALPPVAEAPRPPAPKLEPPPAEAVEPRPVAPSAAAAEKVEPARVLSPAVRRLVAAKNLDVAAIA
ncbi:MAG: biotin/lipoyl-containing protein, partial [Nitrospirota bacterium]